MSDIEQIKSLAKERKIQLTDHALKRAVERGIDIENDIVSALLSCEIIEEYPDDFPFKSYLVLGITLNGKAIHIVCAIGKDLLWIITEYFPDSSEWENDFRTRKKV